MATDFKARVPGLEPGTPAAGAEKLQNGQNYYTANHNKSNTPTLRIQAALWWFERDFLILPVQPNSKRLVRGFGAYQDKITTSEEVYEWFGQRSLSNIAVCGTQTNFILDFDDADLYQSWVREFPSASRTYTEQTPRGGYHVFARAWRRDLNGVELIKGVELKRVVVVSPSKVDNKPYIRGAGDLLDLDATLILSPLSKAPIIPQGSRVGIHSTGYLQKIKSAYSCLALIESTRPGMQISQPSKRFITITCPFHDDTEPSFWIDTDRNLWGCHACSMRGDVINLYARLKGITNNEAIRALGETL